MAEADAGDKLGTSPALEVSGGAPRGALERETAAATYLTSINAETKSKSAKSQSKFRWLEVNQEAGRNIVQHHDDLKELACTLDKRMEALLREHDNDFFLTFKTHMLSVQKELKALKDKADKEEAKTREDEKIRKFESELDWFMTEALKLDEICKEYKKEVDKWKAKAEALSEDRRFLEDQIKGAKRQNKVLRAAAERARSSAYSALMVTKTRSDNQDGEPLNGGRETPTEGGRSRGVRPSSAHSEGRSRIPGGSGRKALENGMRSRTPEPTQLARNAPAGGYPATGSNSIPRGAGSSSVPELPILPSSPAHHSVLGNDAEQRYVETIAHLKESITREQRTVRMLQGVRANSYTKKSTLEEFFLRCIDEARRELMRRRHLSMHKEKNERQRVLEAMLTNEDVLVCLYEKLFPHRTGMARHLYDDGRAMGVQPSNMRETLSSMTPSQRS